jgi:MYXO-CTERM domain-containing protein
MNALNIVRTVISLFILLLIGVSVAGWVWTGRHQTASQASASHVVLTLGALAAVVGLLTLWRPRRPSK